MTTSTLSKPFIIILIFLSTSCQENSNNTNLKNEKQIQNMKKIDVQGHRGCRGLLPENTIEAFERAIELGVTTLEMDVIVSKDKKVVVSHEPLFNSEICSDTSITNMYQVNYSEIKKVDCGLKIHERFPKQEKIATYKPLLTEVIEKMDVLSAKKIRYNIEIKSVATEYNTFYPEPAEFVKLMAEIVKKHDIGDRVTLQSFDVNVLNELHDKYPEITTAYLVENNKNFKQAFTLIHYTPKIYSPDFKLISPELIKFLNEKNIKLIPWTVNETSEMKRLIDLGVDGIITDYPDKLIELLK